MSLLNQMLTDLEQRRGDSSSSPLPTLENLNPPASRLRPTVLAVVGVVVVLGALAYWYLPLPSAPAEVAAPATQSPVVVPATDPAPAPAAEAAPAPPTDATPVQTARAPSPVAAAPARASSSARVATPPSTPAAAPGTPRIGTVTHGQVRKTESPQQKADFLYRQGLNALQQGRNTEAVPLLQEAVQIHPDAIEARQTLAVTLMMQGRAHEAEPVLLDGLQRSSGQAALSQLLGRLQFERGQLPQAQATLEKGLSVSSSDPQLNSLLALVSQRQGQHPKAATHFLAALRSDPTMPAWLTGLATSWEAMGMRAEAREALERALQSGRMNEDLAAFARQKLAQLN